MTNVGMADVGLELSPELLRQISIDGGGRVVLVTGAGCSMEAPTGLRSGAHYSSEAYRRLVADGVLAADSCANSSDLSELAEVVFGATGSQVELTHRLPRDEMRMATPNAGHKAAAALLIEGALRAIITLNYDLALQTALSMLGASPEITIIRGPEEHEHMGARCLVFLHRSVEAPEEEWVLRRSVLEDAWRDAWEEAVARGALAAPVTVFAGLGSPAAVLTESVQRLVPLQGTSFYLADPNPDSAFVDAIGEHLTAVIPAAWCEFARRLSDRLGKEHLARLRDEAMQLAAEAGWSEEDPEAAIQGLDQVGLVTLGHVRAVWLLHDRMYMPETRGTDSRQLADLLLGLSLVARTLGAAVTIDGDGNAHLQTTSGPPLHVLCAHGGGVLTWAGVAQRLRQRSEHAVATTARMILVSGLRAESTAPPSSLMRVEDPDDLIRGSASLIPLEVDDVRFVLANQPEELRARLAS